jgi:hypothetical protein
MPRPDEGVSPPRDMLPGFLAITQGGPHGQSITDTNLGILHD